MAAKRIKEATGGVVVPEVFAQLVKEQNHRIYVKLGCSEEFANVLGELARCRAADLTQDEGEWYVHRHKRVAAAERDRDEESIKLFVG